MSVGEHQNKVLADIKGLSHPKIKSSHSLQLTILAILGVYDFLLSAEHNQSYFKGILTFFFLK